MSIRIELINKVFQRAALAVIIITVGLSVGQPLGLFSNTIHAAETFLGGEESKVRVIGFEGNHHIDRSLLLEHVQSTKIGQPVDPANLRADAQRIVEMGYFEEVEPQLEAFLGGVKVVFVVREFPVIEHIDITVHDGVVDPDDVRNLLGINEGEVLNVKQLSQTMDDLPLTTADELGYLLEPVRVEFGGEQGEILVIELSPLYVGKIIIEGNDKTKDEVILRELTFGEGDHLSMDEVRNSLRKLGQLGYFEPIAPEFLTTADPGIIDVLLPVTETKTGTAAFGAGYSSRDGLLGYIEVSDSNMFGKGQTGAVKWEFGGRSNTYDLSFSEPYLFGTDTSIGFNLYRMNRTYPDDLYEAHSSGGELTLGRRLALFTRGYLTFKMDNISRTPQPGSSETASSNKTRSIIAALRTDTTDHLYYPTEGFRFDVSGEFARPFFDGDTLFDKYRTSLSRYFKVGRNNQTLAFRGILGFSTGAVPLEDEFRVGGADTVRGYRYGEMRGDRMLVAQGEYRIPLSDNVSGVLFVDAGNAWYNDSVDLKDLKVGGGAGIRFDTPLGIIRLDYGMSEKGGEVYFSLGPTF